MTERLMWTRRVVVGEVGAQQAPEMPFVEHEEVVKAFPADGADDALGEGILAGRQLQPMPLMHRRFESHTHFILSEVKRSGS